MNAFLPSVLALVIGIVIGAWQPRGELLAARAEMDTLRAQAAKPCRGRAADAVTRILRAEPPTAPKPTPSTTSGTPETPKKEGLRIEVGSGDKSEEPRDAEEATDAMRTALEARRAQALAALEEQAELDEAQMNEVASITDAMNAELKTEIDAFVEEAVAAGEVDRRDVMDFAAEALDVVIAADDRMRAAIPAEAYAAADDEAVDPLSFLSGDTVASLTRLEGIAGPGD